MRRKILAVAAAATFSFQGIVCTAQGNVGKVDVRPVNTDGEMIIDVALPDGSEQKEVYVYVLNPGMTIDSIVDLNMAENMKVFQYNGQKEYDDEGISFVFNMNTSYVNFEIEPLYNVYAVTEDGEWFTFSFTYYDESQREYLVAEINRKKVLAADVEDITEKYSLQYLNELYGRSDAGTIAGKINALSDGNVSHDNVEVLYIRALLTAAAKNGKLTIDDLKKYNAYIGIEEEIIMETEELTDKGKGIAEKGLNVDLNDISSLKAVAEKNIITGAIYGNVNEGNGVLDKVIQKYKNFFIDNGLDWEHYKSLNKTSVGSTILKGSQLSFDELIDKINEMKSSDKGSNTSTGGGGGGGGKTGGSSFASVAPQTVTKGEKISGFTDLGSVEWARESIERLYENEVINGKSNGIFAPNDIVTREEFVKMICGAFDIKKGMTEVYFSDVPEDRWSYTYIVTASSAGIIKGDGELFRPGECISREDMATILVRVLNSNNVYPPVDEYEVSFSDAYSISDYAKESINILYRNGVINGRGNNTFAPSDNATRAEAAKMICGVLDLM